MPELFDMSNIGLTNEEYDDYANKVISTGNKLDRLASARQEKINRLSQYNPKQYMNDDSLTDTEVDGLWANNKVFNEYNPAELQYLQGRVYDELGVYETPDGYMTKDVDGNLVPFAGTEQDLASFYGFGTGNEDVKKAGKWAGGVDPKTRYLGDRPNVDKYGNAIGPEGVDVNQQDMNLLYPRGVDTLMEGLLHGNKYTLDNRADKEEGFRNRFGTGSTEAYTDGWVGAFGGDSREYEIADKEKLWQDFSTRYGLDKLKQQDSVDYLKGADELLKQREGFRDAVYLDSLGNPTVGYGHLLSEEEKEMYPVGTRIPEEQLNAWYKEDSLKAKKAARDQLKELNLGKEAFPTLVSMNYQLGTNWVEEWPETASAIKNGDIETAIQNIANSKWAEQTPKRAADAIVMLQGKDVFADSSVGGKKDYEAIAVKYDLEREMDEGRLANLADAAQYGVGRKAAGIGDAIVDGMLRVAKEGVKQFNGSSEEELNKNLQKSIKGTFMENWFNEKGDFVNLDEYKTAIEYGYNDAATKEVLKNVGEAYKNKDWLGVAKEVLRGVVTAGPEFLLESSGEIATAALGPAGLALNSADYSNKILEERQRIKDTTDLDFVDYVYAMVGGTAQGYLNKVGADEILGNTQMVRNAMKVLKMTGTDDQVKSTARKILGTAVAVSGTVAGKGAYEGLEEVAQEAVGIVAEKFGTEEANKIISEESGQRLVEGFAGGFAGGATASGVSTIRGFSAEQFQREIQRRQEKKKESTNVDLEEKAEKEVSVENAKESFGRVNYTLSPEGTGITETNVGIFVEDVSNMKQFIDEYDDGTDSFNQSKEIYEKSLDSLEGFIRSNPNTKLTKNTLDSIGMDGNKITKVKEYDSKTSAVVAEELGHVILGSDRKFDEEFKTNITTFLKTNGVSEARIQEMVRTYENVREEATTGQRGYMSYESNINRILDSDNPDKGMLARSYNKLVKFRDSTSDSIEKIKASKIDAQKEADKYNNLPSMEKGKAKQFKTSYMKLKTDSSGKPIMKNGKFATEPFLVNIKYSTKDKKWVPDFSELNKRLKEKEDTLRGSNKAINSVTSRVNEATGGKTVSNKFIAPDEVPGLSKSITTQRKSDNTYYNKAKTLVNRVTHKDGDISKVIIDEDRDKRSGKWAESQDYYKNNMHLINSEEYSADDVVLVNALGTFEFTPKGSKKAITRSELVSKKDQPVAEEFQKAVEAKSSILLDREFVANTEKGSKEYYRYASVVKFLKDNDYEMVDGDKPLFIHKNNLDNESLNKFKEEINKEKEKKKEEAKQKKRAVELFLRKNSETFSSGNEIDKEKLTEYVKEFDGLPEELKEKAAKEVRSRVNRAVKEVKENTPIGESQEGDDVRIIKAAKEKIESMKDADKFAEELLTGWQDLLDEGLSGKKLDAEVDKLLEGLNVDSKEVLSSWLKEDSIGSGKQDINVLTNKVQTTKNDKVTTTIRSEVLFRDLNKKEKELYGNNENEKVLKTKVNKNEKTGNEIVKTIPIVRKVLPQDISRYTEVNKATILNSIPFDNLPYSMRTLGMDFIKSLGKIAPALQDGELNSKQREGKFSGKGKGDFNLKDSPSRALLYGTDGNIMPNVATAMQVALMDILRTDKSKLMPGYKDDKSIAAMFQVQEFEVTDAMRSFSRGVGAFKKTVANSVGKAVLANLGITRKNANDVGIYNYERLVADAGNLAIMAGKEQGLVKVVGKDSNEIQDLRKDADGADNNISDEAKTFFVTLTSEEVKVKGAKFSKHEGSTKVKEAIKAIEAVVEKVPSMKTKTKGPLRHALKGANLDRQANKVLNDASGMEVPKKAQETLKTMMKTEYSMEVGRVKEFLDLVDSGETRIKEILGFVDLDGPEYASMFGDDKEVQEGINRSIDKSIEELRTFLADNESRAVNGRIPMYFKFVYQTNGRYMLDSNTINPQSDTLHRFFVLPTDMGSKVKVDAKTGIFTSSKGNDVSLQVRFAIGQAFGFDVDKVGPKDIIEFGNHMLNMSPEQVDKAIKDVLTTGKAEVVHGKKPNTISKEIEADHLSHTLQALNFIKEFSEGKTEITTFLSEEHDSLTSGFANKLLQMPILNPDQEEVMHEHLARVGVITQQYLNKQVDEETADKIRKGGVGALLGSEGFYDSYKNLAKKVVVAAKEHVQGAKKASKERTGHMAMYNAISSTLPGSEVISGSSDMEIKIDSAMRSMFKNPFMIFNYSASINRIKKNLSYDIAVGTLRSIAKGDEVGKKVAENLLEQYPSISLGNTNIKTASGLIKALRDNKSSAIKYKPKSKSYAKPLVSGLQDMAMEIYGNKVEEVFKKEFGAFIKVQDDTNDAFKVMFRLFNYQRQKTIQAKVKENGMITAKDQKEILDDLWDKFPAVMGPLSDKGKVKEIIPVTASELGSPNVTMSAGPSPQTVLNVSTGRTINPVVRDISEAVNAGAVVPYHFIDGAEMAEMFDAMAEEAGILAIHDAVMGDMDGSDSRPFNYNKGMYNINKNYSIIGAIKEKLDVVQKSMEEMSKDRDFKKITSKGLKANPVKNKVPKYDNFEDAANTVFSNFNETAETVENARKEWYKEGGIFENALFGNMINGSASAMYNPAKGDVMDTSYKKELKDLMKLNTDHIKSVIINKNTKNIEENAIDKYLVKRTIDVDVSSLNEYIKEYRNCK